MIERNAFEVMGTMTRITPEEEQSEKYGLIWKEFESYHDQIKLLSIDGKYYGVTFNTDIERVFECSIKNIAVTYQTIFLKWLPGSLYEINPAAPSFEQYPPAGKESDPIHIHIPVKK